MGGIAGLSCAAAVSVHNLFISAFQTRAWLRQFPWKTRLCDRSNLTE
jgi:hypothetical protein